VKVLIVDDSRTVRRFTCDALGAILSGTVIVLEAHDGIEALKLIEDSDDPIEVVLCDWTLPKMTGITFLKQVKASAPRSNMHIIMMMREADQKHVAEALRWGARDTIVKPFTEELLKAKLKKIRPRPSMNDTAVLLHTIAQERVGTEAPPEAPPEASETGLVGTLDTLPISDLIQILHACRKTGHLRLRQGSEQAGIYFIAGEIRHAWTLQDSGESAFFHIVEWQKAYFTFESGLRVPEPTLTQATLPLLMEGLRRVDEKQRPRPGS
jgi:two-component system chemotaxis response regulator CheY